MNKNNVKKKKNNVVYTHGGILFHLMIKRNSAICNNMDEPQGYYTKRNKPATERQMLHDPAYLRYVKQSNL